MKKFDVNRTQPAYYLFVIIGLREQILMPNRELLRVIRCAASITNCPPLLCDSLNQMLLVVGRVSGANKIIIKQGL
jgi:hypothetical protein